jgi:putative tryptophan/tyrosine transport system substrate-binding protein
MGNVRFWHKADISSCTAHVRFRGQSGHDYCIAKCPLMTQSGHRPDQHLGPAASISHAPDPFQSADAGCYDALSQASGVAVRRREFIKLLGGAPVAWPLAAQSQPGERLRRVGMLLPATANDSEYPTLVNAFVEGLQQLGWTDGRNIRIDIRWAGGGADANRKYAEELVALAPDVIMAAGNASAGPMLQATRTIPIVFTIVPDPVGAGLVDSLGRPSGNATGFTSFAYEIGGKWLGLLKEIAPRVTRVAVIRDSAISAGVGQWSAIQTAAPTFGMEATPINLTSARELERAISDFARSANGGLIVTSSGLAISYRDLIVMQAARQRLPAVYYSSGFVSAGGLISYGSDRIDQFRNAAGYVDRILKGEKPANLPVQAPTKYQLVINLKSAKALGLTVPPLLLARADEVIE